MNAHGSFVRSGMATHSERLDALIAAATLYKGKLTADPTSHRLTTQHAWLAVCEAACWLWDDGDASAAAENARDELGIDDEGYPVNENGDRMGEQESRLPVGMFTSHRGFGA